jgi:hypothetical protein
MSMPNETRGGAIAIRGLLVQTIVALLDITKANPPFTAITLEPMIGDDQFDFLSSARPAHARLAALSDGRADWPRQRAKRSGRSLGDRRARPDAVTSGGHSSVPRPPLRPFDEDEG